MNTDAALAALNEISPLRTKSQQSFISNEETIHYLSPATTNRTEYEGDFDYRQFMGLMPKSLPTDIALSDLSNLSTISCEEIKYQRTVAIVKPDAMIYKDVVLKAINDHGFPIVNQRLLHLTPEQVAEVYAQHYGCPSFPNLVVSMSMSPLLVLSLAGLNTVIKWKNLVGPDKAIKEDWFWFRHVMVRFGLQPSLPEMLHASNNLYESDRENRYFFPEPILEPIVCEEDKVKDYCGLYVNPTLIKGLVELLRYKPVDPIMFLAEWLLLHNPFQPRLPDKVAITPT